jgi:hypothetical protein
VKILATVPLHLMEVQIEIVKAYIYFMCKLAKYNKITFAICQAKKYKQFSECGLIQKMELAGIDVKLLDKTIKEDKSRKQMWLMDNKMIEQELGSDYDLVMFYAFSISSDKQMAFAFNKFYESGELKVTFNSMIGKYKQTYPLYYISKKFGVPTFQFVVDWLEPDLRKIYQSKDVYRFGVYKHKELGVRFMPIYDMYIFRKSDIERKLKKSMDFVFGYTITYVGRKYLHESIQRSIVETDKIKLYARDRYWEPEARDDVIPQDEYFEKIAAAKFSFVLPANDKKEFSIQRFHECISRMCIPLIDSRCVLSNVFGDYPDIVEFWEKNNMILNLDDTTINKALAKLNYDILIKGVLALDSIQKLFNKERYESFLKNFDKNVKNMFTSVSP